MKAEDCFISIAGQTLVATRILAASEEAPSVISFHGYGPAATRTRIRYVLDHLADHGISSVCFDFSGNGESTGVLADSSLSVRLNEAKEAARLLALKPSPAIIGTSMGGFLAALLAPGIEPRSLILFCPAAYPKSAMEIPFNDDFPGIARRPGAYKDSPAFQALRAFKGNLLIFAARNDAVVVREVIDSYTESAVLAKSRKVVVIEGSDHGVHPWLMAHEEDRRQVLKEIVAVATEAPL